MLLERCHPVRRQSELEGELLVFWCSLDCEVTEVTRFKQAGGDTGRKCFAPYRDDRDSRTECITCCCVCIVRLRIEEDIGERKTREVLSPGFGSRRIDEPGTVDATPFRLLRKIILYCGRGVSEP